MWNKRCCVAAVLAVLGLVAPALAGLAPAMAQDYPTRPVRIVVASVAGSAPDVLARRLADGLTAALKQQVLVENRAGAGGIVGVEAAARAPNDGYTLVVGHDGTMAFLFAARKNMPYDPSRDFTPITQLGNNEFVLIANAASPVRSFAEFVAHAKQSGGRAAYASAGAGTPNQLIMEVLALDAGFTMTHIPYKGGAAAVADVVGGQVPFMIAGLAPALPQIRAGKVRALAVPQARRSSALPDVPTIGESLRGFAERSWFGLFGPAGMRAEIVTRLNREVRAVLEKPDNRDALAQLGLVVETGEPAALGALVTADIARYRRLLERVKIDLD